MTVFTRPPSTPNNKLKPFKGTLKTGEKIRNINGKSFVVPADIKKPDGSPTINASNIFQASNIPVGSAELREKIKVFGLDAQLETIELAESKVAQIINDETKTVDAAVANADEKDKNGSAPVGPGTPSPRRDLETPNLIQNPLEKFSTVSSLWTMLPVSNN